MKRGKWWTSLKRYIAIRPQASSPRSLSISLSLSINPIVRSFVRSFIRSFVRSAIRHQKSQASSRSIHDGGIRSINRNRGGEWPTFEIQCLSKSLSPLLREFEEGKIEGKSLHADDTIFVVISFLQNHLSSFKEEYPCETIIDRSTDRGSSRFIHDQIFKGKEK